MNLTVGRNHPSPKRRARDKRVRAEPAVWKPPKREKSGVVAPCTYRAQLCRERLQK